MQRCIKTYERNAAKVSFGGVTVTAHKKARREGVPAGFGHLNLREENLGTGHDHCVDDVNHTV